MPAGSAQAEARRYIRTAGLLSVGVGLAGVLAYAYFALASHTLDRTQYGEIVVLWSAVFILVSTIFRPVEQLLSRTVAEREAHGHSTGRPLRVAAVIQLALACVFVAVGFALRGPIERGLFSSDDVLFFVFVGSVVAFGGSFYARGFLAGSRFFDLYGLLLIIEGFSRAAFALVVAVGLASGQHVVALGVVTAPCLSLLVVPFAIARRRDRSGARRAEREVERTASGRRDQGAPAFSAFSAEPEFTFAEGGGFAAAVLIVMITEQILLSSGPLLIRASQGAPEAGFIFNVLMVARAPLVLFQAVATSLLPHLTRLRSRGARGNEAFQLSVQATVGAIAAFTVVVLGVLLAAGPDLMQLAFGAKFNYDRAGLLIVGIGMGFYLSAATLNQAALAQGQARRAALRWGACGVAFLAWNFIPVLTDFRRVELGFAGAATVLCGLLYLLYRSPVARPVDVVAPGSPQEIEARLAAADEAT